VNRVQGAQDRLLKRAGGGENRAIDWQQGDGVQEFLGPSNERFGLKCRTWAAARRIARGTSISASSLESRSASARKERSASVSGSARTSFTSAEASR
jgi:hypothetical protein